MRFAASVGLMLAVVACPRPVPPPAPPPDADVTCVEVCAHFRELGCPAAEPTPEGATCTEVCDNVMHSGTIVWNLSCMRRAPSCAAADSCN